MSERVHVNPDDPLDPLVFMCDVCGRLWASMTAAQVCCELVDDPRWPG